MLRNRTAVALALGAALALGPAAGAVAADDTTGTGGTDYSGALVTEWTTRTVNLAWDSTPYATDTVSFIGTPVISPGDHAVRTVQVTNDGPTAGVLKAWIVNATTQTPTGETSTVNPLPQPGQTVGDTADPFYDDLAVSWAMDADSGSKSIAALAAAPDRTTGIGDVLLAKGESTNLTISYDFPKQALSGNTAAVGDQPASFDVLLVIQGDGEDGGAPGGGATSGAAAPTGADVLALALAILVLVALGGVGIWSSRRPKPRADDTDDDGGPGGLEQEPPAHVR